jgi:hypothetical protein
MKYAKDTYKLGLTTGYTSTLSPFPEADVIAAIKQSQGIISLTLDFHFVAPLTPELLLGPYLYTQREWNPMTGLVSRLDGLTGTVPKGSSVVAPVHLVTITSIDFMESTGIVTITYLCKSFDSKITFGGLASPFAQNVLTETVNLGINHQFGLDHCVAAYKKPADDTLYWWIYCLESLLHPELNYTKISETETETGLPVVPLRYDNVNLTENDYLDTDLYKTSKELLKKIALNIDEISTRLHEHDEIDEIDHAYILFGIDLQDPSDTAIEYLYHFFSYVYQTNPFSLGNMIKDKGENGIATPFLFGFNDGSLNVSIDASTYEKVWSGNPQKPTVEQFIQRGSSAGSLTDHGLDTSLLYSYIEERTVEEVIGKVGEYKLVKEEGDPNMDGLGVNYPLGGGIDAYDMNEIPPMGAVETWDTGVLRLQLQITPTHYREIRITGLTHINKIYHGMSVVTGLTDIINDADNMNLVIPLHYPTCFKLNIQKLNILYQESLRLSLHSYVIQKIKWYETGFWKFVIMIGIALISIKTGQPWLIKLNAALKIGGAFLMNFVFKAILITVAVNQVFKFVAKKIGGDLAALLGLAIAVTGLAASRFFSTSLVPHTKFTWAEALLFLGNGLLGTAPNQYAYEAQFLSNEYAAWQAEIKEKREELTALEELLSPTPELVYNLVDIQRADSLHPFSHNPGWYYQTTVHTGNIGVLALESISTYHNTMVKLPDAFMNKYNPLLA